MRLPRDILNAGLYTKPNFYLCETDKEKICKLETTDTKGSFKFNSMSELSFETARVYNDVITGETKINPFFDKIEALRLIEVEGFGYFELQGPELISDGIVEKKSCTAYSLEYTLAQKYLNDFYINIGTVESLEVINASSDNIVPITLYNPSNPKLSLLHLVLSEVYGWTVGHVDASLKTLSRQFEIDRESVYDFLTNEVCEKFNCYIVFDTINNTINVYAESLTSKFIGDGYTNTFTITPPFAQIGTVSVNGYKTTRWEYNVFTGMLTLEDTPESGAHIEVVDGALTEWETDVFVSFDNLAQEVNINYDADSIKTKLTVTYGDDGDIREVNLGLPYLTDISYYYTVDWMGRDLYDAYTEYMQKSNELQSEYTSNSQEIFRINDHIAYEEYRLSLEYSLVQSVNSTTVGTYYIRQQNSDGSYYYKEVSLPNEYNANENYYSNVTTNVNEEKVQSLYSVLKKYFNNENTDGENITSWKTALNELGRDFEFMQTYTLSYLSTEMSKIASNRIGNATAEKAINNFLGEMWNEIGRTPLRELYLESYQQIKSTNIEAGWSQANNDNYPYYYPVNIYISSIEKAISNLDKKIEGYKTEQTTYVNANATISNGLLMRNNFTEDQLIRLSAFLREDELHIDDIIETDLDDLSSSFKIKQDAMESGRIELQKLSQPQLQFSMTMANIYALSEFAPIINQFQLGKVIKVCLRPDYIKQSRLLQVDINFDDFSDFSCEFGELTSLRTQSDLHADLLSNAITAGKSVATNSSYWTRGSDRATAIDLKIQQGLLDATTKIKAIDGTQGVVIDKYGIKLQKNMPNDEIDPHQTWLVNNMILMSDDGFQTSRSAIGQVTVNGEEIYGLLADAVLAGHIEGSKIVGGEIFSENYEHKVSGTYFDLINGDFEIAGGNIVYDTKDKALTLKNVTIEWSSTTTPEIKDISGLEDYLDQIDELENQLDGRAETWYQATDPSTNWKTDNDKALHVGDLWHYTGETSTVNGVRRIKNSEWVWQKVNNTYSWVSIEISDEVFDAIDGKAQIFTSTPTPPYYVGDLWVQGSNGDIMRCIQERTTGNYVANDWEKASKYTDDALASQAKNIADNAKSTGDKLVNGLGFQETEINGKYIISPSITGGYLNITNTSNNSRVIIDPNNITNEGLLIQVRNGNTVTLGIDKDGNASFEGNITASSGEISGNLNISGSLINTSGNYSVTLRGVQSNQKLGVFYITDKSSGSAVYPFRVNGDGSVYAKNIEIVGGSININDKFKVDVNGNVTLPSNATITWEQVTDKDDVATKTYVDNKGYQTEAQVTKITKDTVTTTYVNALNITAKDFSATTITGKTISGGSISGTSIDNGNGTFSVNSSGEMTAKKGTIGGWVIKESTLQYPDIVNGVGTVGSMYLCPGGTTTNKKIGGSDAISGWGITVGNAFGVTTSGALYANSANISGVLTAGTGSSLGDFSVDNNSIFSGSWSASKDQAPDVFMCTGTNNEYTLGGVKKSGWAFGAGDKFGVTRAGEVYSSSLHLANDIIIDELGVTGTYTSKSGTVKGITVTWNAILTAAMRWNE